jgi:hypothetical protein
MSETHESGRIAETRGRERERREEKKHTQLTKVAMVATNTRTLKFGSGERHTGAAVLTRAGMTDESRDTAST